MRVLLALAGCLLVSLLGVSMPRSKMRNDKSWRTYSVDAKNVLAADFSPDGRYVAFVTAAGKMLQEGLYKEDYSDNLEVWDFRVAKLITKTMLRQVVILDQSKALAIIGRGQHVRYTRDGRFIVASDSLTLHLFNTADYSEMWQISLSPLPTNDRWTLRGVEVSPDSLRILVWLGSKSYQGVRLYDLASGKLEREWEFNEGTPGWIVWSPDGRKLTITWMAALRGERVPPNLHNLLVVDATSGEKLLGINTGLMAGPVAFGEENTLLTVSLSSDDKTAKKDTIKVWDATTGRLLREIASPGAGVHNQMETSADGQIVFGYTNQFKYRNHFNETTSQKFRLWRVATGEVIATSPEILPLDDYAWEPQFRLSAKGNLVLIWRQTGSAPPTVYELQ